MEKIIGMGNALVDVLVQLKQDTVLQELDLPKGSMTLINNNKLNAINKLLSQLTPSCVAGGSAGNVVRALVEVGGQGAFIGKIANDDFGKLFSNSLASRGVETRLLYSDTLPSGVASTFISADGERTFATYLGAASELKAEELKQVMFEDYQYLFIEGYLVQDHEMITHALHLAKEMGLVVCLDLASYNVVASDKDFFTHLINKYVDIVFANEQEAHAFTGLSPREAIDEIAKICSIAVVKERKEGTHIRKGTEYIHVDAPLVKEVIDTTGAGDYFAAGFLYGLSMGQSLERCAQLGTMLAGEVIQVVGTELPATTWSKIKETINK